LLFRSDSEDTGWMNCGGLELPFWYLAPTGVFLVFYRLDLESTWEITSWCSLSSS
jgi:hypothetical protein